MKPKDQTGYHRLERLVSNASIAVEAETVGSSARLRVHRDSHRVTQVITTKLQSCPGYEKIMVLVFKLQRYPPFQA
jgi:hypothetical protein